MPIKYAWSDVKSDNSFNKDTNIKKEHVIEIIDALAKFRAAYKHSDMSLIGWWWHPSSRYLHDKSYYNGWKSSSSSLKVSVDSSDNLQLVTTTSGSEYIESLIMNLYPPAKSYPEIGPNGHRYLLIKLKSSVSLSNLQLGWTTQSAPTTWRTQTLPPVARGDEWKIYEIDLASNGHWTGNLRQLRIIPNEVGAIIQIEYLLIDKEDLRTVNLDSEITKASEMINIRKWAARANGSAGSSASVSWSDASLTSGDTIIKAIHFKEIREQIDLAYGKNRGWASSNCDGYLCSCNTSCDVNTPCSCESGCNVHVKPKSCTCHTGSCHIYTPSRSCTCNDSCNGYVRPQSCQCYQTCYQEVPCSCYNINDGYTCGPYSNGKCRTTCNAYVACKCDTPGCNIHTPPRNCTCNSTCNGYVAPIPCTCDGECNVHTPYSCNCDRAKDNITCFTCDQYTAGT